MPDGGVPDCGAICILRCKACLCRGACRDFLDLFLDLPRHCVLDGARRTLGYFVDVLEREDVADAGRAGLEEHSCWALEAEEELTVRLVESIEEDGSGLTLSPHIDLRSHVFTVWYIVASVLHVAVWLMTLKNLTFWTKDPKPRSGTWNRRLEDLKRKGRGGVEEVVYATTLLLRVSFWIETTKVECIPWMRNIALASLQLDLIYLPAAHQREQPPSGDIGVAPVRYSKLDIILWLERQRLS